MFWKAVAAKERVEKLKLQAALVTQQQAAADAALVAVLKDMDVDLTQPIEFDYDTERVINSATDGQPPA